LPKRLVPVRPWTAIVQLPHDLQLPPRPALVTNGDYQTIRANPLENNLAQWPDFQP
jgi:hypothetical protein